MWRNQPNKYYSGIMRLKQTEWFWSVGKMESNSCRRRHRRYRCTVTVNVNVTIIQKCDSQKSSSNSSSVRHTSGQKMCAWLKQREAKRLKLIKRRFHQSDFLNHISYQRTRFPLRLCCSPIFRFHICWGNLYIIDVLSFCAVVFFFGIFLCLLVTLVARVNIDCV